MKRDIYESISNPQVGRIVNPPTVVIDPTRWKFIGTIEVEEPKKDAREEIAEILKTSRIAEYKGWQIYLDSVRHLLPGKTEFTIIARFYREYVGRENGRLLGPRPEPMNLECKDNNLLAGVVWLCDRIDDAGALERVIIAPKKTVTKQAEMKESSLNIVDGSAHITYFFPPGSGNFKPPTYEVEE
jgi:hypothetical protein